MKYHGSPCIEADSGLPMLEQAEVCKLFREVLSSIANGPECPKECALPPSLSDCFHDLHHFSWQTAMHFSLIITVHDIQFYPLWAAADSLQQMLVAYILTLVLFTLCSWKSISNYDLVHSLAWIWLFRSWLQADPHHDSSDSLWLHLDTWKPQNSHSAGLQQFWTWPVLPTVLVSNWSWTLTFSNILITQSLLLQSNRLYLYYI